MEWYNIYMKDIEKKGDVLRYFYNKVKTKKKLINLIIKYSPNKKIIESGSGLGIILTYLSSIGYDSTGIDIDEYILKLSKKIAEEYNSLQKPKFINKSIFNLDYNNEEFDVSFSNGVLEHFSDSEIIETLKQQMNIASTVVFGVPTRYFDKSESMYGDERYLENKYWRYLINLSGGKIIEETSYHYMGFWKRVLYYKKYFRPYPYRIFVINKKN